MNCLIVFKLWDIGLDRFSKFKGFDEFVDKFNQAPCFDENVKSHLYDKMKDYFRCFGRNLNSHTSDFDELCDIFDMAGMNIWAEAFDPVFRKINEMKDDFWNKIKNQNEWLYDFVHPMMRFNDFDLDCFVNIQISENHPAYRIWKNAYGDYQNEVNKYLESEDYKKYLMDITETVMTNLKKNDYFVKCISCEDDNYFIFFLGEDPEQKIKVYMRDDDWI